MWRYHKSSDKYKLYHIFTQKCISYVHNVLSVGNVIFMKNKGVTDEIILQKYIWMLGSHLWLKTRVWQMRLFNKNIYECLAVIYDWDTIFIKLQYNTDTLNMKNFKHKHLIQGI